MLALVDTCHAFATAQGRLCACLEQRELGYLRSVAGDARLPAGQPVFAEGDAAHSIYGLRQGTVMLTRRLADGRRQVLSFLFPGDCFGFAADGIHGCTAVPLRPSTFCRFPVQALVDNPQLEARLSAIARARLTEALEHLVRLGRLTAAERVADFLFRLWRRLDCPPELELTMRLADIADHLGLRPETVSRQLAALRQAGKIGPLALDGLLPILDGHSLRRL